MRRVRSASAQNWASIGSLLTRSSLTLAGARDHLGGFVVAEVGGDVRGSAALERYGAVALLRSVAVDPSSRGNGLGQRMVSHLIEVAKREGMRRVVLLTTTADDWFPRFGFRPADRESIAAALADSEELRGASPTSAVVMSLELQD